MVVRNIILAAAVLGVIACGFFIVRRLDRFLDGRKKRAGQEAQNNEPSCHILITDMTDEELIACIRLQEKQHGWTHIVMCRDGYERYQRLSGGKQ